MSKDKIDINVEIDVDLEKAYKNCQIAGVLLKNDLLKGEVKHLASILQGVLTCLNIGDINSESPIHLKIREVMIEHRQGVNDEQG